MTLRPSCGRVRGSYLAGASLAGLERQRGWQAESEVEWLLKQNGVMPHASASRVARLRHTLGAALVRAGERLAGVPRSSTSLALAPAGTLSKVG